MFKRWYNGSSVSWKLHEQLGDLNSLNKKNEKMLEQYYNKSKNKKKHGWAWGSGSE